MNALKFLVVLHILCECSIFFLWLISKIIPKYLIIEQIMLYQMLFIRNLSHITFWLEFWNEKVGGWPKNLARLSSQISKYIAKCNIEPII